MKKVIVLVAGLMLAMASAFADELCEIRYLGYRVQVEKEYAHNTFLFRKGGAYPQYAALVSFSDDGSKYKFYDFMISADGEWSPADSFSNKYNRHDYECEYARLGYTDIWVSNVHSVYYRDAFERCYLMVDGSKAEVIAGMKLKYKED